jgi:phage terminase large subunit
MGEAGVNTNKLHTRAAPRGRSLAGELGRVFRTAAEVHRGKAWPSARWAKDPCAFAYFILGVELWPFQREFLESIRDNPRTAVAAGRKVSKDHTVSVAALWWYCTRDDARVFHTAVNNQQVNGVAYRQMRLLWDNAGRCVACKKVDAQKVLRREQPGPRPCPHSAMLAGTVGLKADTGIVAADLREIKGRTAADPVGLSGLSGANILAIVDEASEYPDAMYNIVQGNLAAEGCRFVAISNPTSPRGWFCDIFHRPQHRDPSSPAYVKQFNVSSTTTPNVVLGREVIPGLASRAWIEAMKAYWGEDSPLYKCHVLGQFVLNEAGAIHTIESIFAAQARWGDTLADGVLTVGIDPAGDGGRGDESAFAPVRGKKCLDMRRRIGLSAEGHLAEFLGMLAEPSLRGTSQERPRAVIDRDGEVGAKVWAVFKAHLEVHPEQFEVIGVRGSEKAKRLPDNFDRIRDELSKNLQDWMKEGGIPEDAKLAKDLNAMRWEDVSAAYGGKSKVIGKDKLREVLGRSPDSGDALALAVWPRPALDAEDMPKPTPLQQTYEQPAEEVFDPYGGSGFDPYGGSGFDPYDALAQQQGYRGGG